MRTIKKIADALEAPMAGLKTWRPFPNNELNNLDPFIFLNHHGPEDFPPNNTGLPFEPHPHRGFETLTFIFQGDVLHKDSTHGESLIETGGIQWMTAGKGIVHEETSSEAFKKNGGTEEVLQLWINLPSHLKMTEPGYTGLQKEDIPEFQPENSKGNVTVNLISGEWDGHKGGVKPLTDVLMSWIDLEEGSSLTLEAPQEKTVLFYIVHGKVEVNGREAETHQAVQFDNNSPTIEVKAQENTRIIYGHGTPLKEPVATYGPFVMNTQQEIQEAIKDYQDGKMGEIPG